MSEKFKTTIGGQAVMEGIMMKGVKKTSLAVRKPDQSIYLETWDNKPTKWYNKKPLVRGVVNFIDTMAVGYRCLMKSAEISGAEEGEPESKFDKWLSEKFGGNLMKVVGAVSSVAGILIAVGLFMFLPAFLVGLMRNFIPRWGLSLLEGLIKITVFIAYLALVSCIPDMKRMFRYHGAEHKTIACYEAGEELTVENIKKHSRFHPRCGTSFLLIVLVLSILVFSVVTWSNPFLRTVLKLALTPVVVAVSYEIIRFAGRHDNFLSRIISSPGLKLQLLTTSEPDAEMIEIAVAALREVLPEKEGEDRW